MIGVFVQVNEQSPKGHLWPLGYVICENGCWEWVGSRLRGGYGSWGGHPTEARAHRAMYVEKYGAIPAGLTLDHLCRNRACVNPDHLEAVTNKANVLRGVGATAQNARKTHCPRGHEYIYTKNPPRRTCMECRRIAGRAHWPRPRPDRRHRLRCAICGQKKASKGYTRILLGGKRLKTICPRCQESAP